MEKCLADKPEETARILARVQEASNKEGIKSIGTYVAAHEHTIYSIVEANDVAALERALLPMTVWGTAKLIPIRPVGQAIKR